MIARHLAWTPETIGSVPDELRRALHWVLFAEAVAGPEGLPADVPIEPGMPSQRRLALMRAKAAAAELRRMLFPED